MKIHSIRDIFNQVISTQGIHNKLGITSQAVRSMRYKMRHGRYPSEKRMRQILEAAGYTPVLETTFIHSNYSKKLHRTRKKLDFILLDPNFDQDLKEILRPLCKSPLSV